MTSSPAPGPLWTVEEACDYFRAGGLPITPVRLRLIIRGLPGFTPAGTAPSSERGGRGKTMYPAADLLRLHTAVTPWLTSR